MTEGKLKIIRAIHAETTPQYEEYIDKLVTKKKELQIIENILKDSKEIYNTRGKNLLERVKIVIQEIEEIRVKIHEIETRREQSQARLRQLQNKIKSFQNRGIKQVRR